MGEAFATRYIDVSLFIPSLGSFVFTTSNCPLPRLDIYNVSQALLVESPSAKIIPCVLCVLYV